TNKPFRKTLPSASIWISASFIWALSISCICASSGRPRRGVLSDMERFLCLAPAAGHSRKLIDTNGERIGQARRKIGGLVGGGVDAAVPGEAAEAAHRRPAVADLQVIG